MCKIGNAQFSACLEIINMQVKLDFKCDAGVILAEIYFLYSWC